MLQCFIVGIGGFVGAVLRYLIGLLPLKNESGLPVKTLFINVIGAFAIGIVATLATRNSLDPKLVLFLKVGICGGFTTFSTFALEANNLLVKGSQFTALLYVILSVILSVLAVFLTQKMLG